MKATQKIMIAALVALCSAGAWCLPAQACGTIRMWTSAYERGQHHKALYHMMDCGYSYNPLKDDQALVPILSDAMTRGPEVRKIAVQVFMVYNCLYGARRAKGYPQLAAAMKKAGAACEAGRFGQWYVVVAKGGANLRQAPSTSGKIITAVRHSMQVRVLERHGQWLKVRPVGPGSVDPQYERVSGYLHQSLVRPY